MSERLVIPKDVVDKVAYVKAIKLAKHRIIVNPLFKTSDGQEMSIAGPIHVIRKKIAHLPADEREWVEQEKALYYNINNNLTIAKRKAFGKKQGEGKASEGSILEMKREEILEYFGRMFTVEDILKIINKEWGFPMGKSTLHDFKIKYSEEIKKRVEHHQVSFHNVRLGIKKSRLEELSTIYKRAKEIWEENENRQDLKIILDIIDQFRKEAEGDRLTIEGKVDIKYEQNIQLHLMKEVFQTTNLKEIILGRVAAKMGINPVKLIYSLQKSYYAQFSNVLGDFDEDEASQDLAYPSQLNYDFERIGKNFKLRDSEIEEAVIVEEKENFNDEAKAKSLKEILAERLKSKTKDLTEMRNKLDVIEEVKRDIAYDEKKKTMKEKKEAVSSVTKKKKK